MDNKKLILKPYIEPLEVNLDIVLEQYYDFLKTNDVATYSMNPLIIFVENFWSELDDVYYYCSNSEKLKHKLYVALSKEIKLRKVSLNEGQ